MANSASNISLNDVVSITLRRGIPITERQDPLHQKLAILNFSDEGPYALDGVLPVFIAPLSSIEQDQLASRFNFDLDALINRGEDPTIPVDGNNEGIITWRRLFSVDPESTADYSDVGWGLREGIQLDLFVNESLNIYRSLFGFQFDVNNPSNIDTGKSIVSFNTYMPGGNNTETREAFVRSWNDYQVAGFSNVNIPHDPGYEWSNYYDEVENSYPLDRPSVDPGTPDWMRLLNIEFKSVVHEQGHSLGLQHPGVYDGHISGTDWVLWNEDSWDQSIMSYVMQPKAYSVLGTTQGFSLLNLTPRTLDLLALDQIYKQQEDSQGKTFGIHRAFPGDTTYGFNTNITEDQSIVYANLDKLYDHRIATTIADGEGIDTIDASEFKYGNTIDLYVLTGNETSSRLSSLNGTIGNLSLAVGTVIENAIGGDKDDKIFDNQYNNRLVGNAGDDWFSASGGIDRIIGGSGRDRAVIDGNEDDFIIKNKSKSKTVIRHKTNRDFRVTLKDVEKYIFGDPMESAMNSENRGGEMVAGSKSDRRSNALLGMPDEEPSLNFLGASDQLL